MAASRSRRFTAAEVCRLLEDKRNFDSRAYGQYSEEGRCNGQENCCQHHQGSEGERDFVRNVMEQSE